MSCLPYFRRWEPARRGLPCFAGIPLALFLGAAALAALPAPASSQTDPRVIEIIDDGIPFDPLTEAPEPDLTSPIEDRPIGGLGVHFTKSLMDDVEYCRESGKNRLKIVARRVRADG